jgi:molybdate transport system substrate-binding protein
LAWTKAIIITAACVAAAAAKGFAAFALLFQTSHVTAAELKVFSNYATRAIVEDLGPKFEKASNYTIESRFANTKGTLKRIQGGEIPDVVLTTQDGIDSLLKDGKVVNDNVIVIARSGLGVAVRKGARKPDISSPEALKRALLAAKSITYNNPASGGASGVHFAKVLERLGIAKEVQAKTIYSNNEAGSLVAAGKAELGVTQMASLMRVKGVEVVGPLPGDLQASTVYAAAIPSGAKHVNAAKALVAFLRGPEAAKVFKAKGMEPG